MAGTGRRLGSDEWQALVGRHCSSGLTVEAFCRREGVSTASFYRWRGLQSPDTAKQVANREPTFSGPGAFLDIGEICPDPSPSPRSSIRLSLQFGSLRLQLERG